jgi:exonuclease SbcC
MMGLGERAPLEGALAHAERYLASTRVNVGVASVALSGLGVAHAAAQTALKAAKARKDAHEHHARALVQAKLAREAARLEVSRLDAKLALMDGARQRIAAGEVELAAVPGLREERDKLMLCKQHVVEHMVLTAQANKLAAEIKMAQDGIKAAAHDIGLYDEAADRHTGTAMVAVKERLDGLKQARVGRRSAIQARIGGTEGARDIIRTKLDVLEDAGQEGACPTCGRVLMDCYQDVCDEMRDELAAIDATLGDLRLALGKQGLPSEEEVHAAASLEVATAEVRRHTQLAVNASRAQVATEHSKVALARAEKALEDVNARLAQIPDFAYDPTELERVEADLTRLDLLDRELVGDRALLAQETEARGLLEERHKMLDDAKAAIATAEWGIADSGYEPVDFAETERGAESARKAAEDARVALARAEEAERGAGTQAIATTDALAAYDRRAVRLNEVSADHLTHEHTATRLADFRLAIASTIRPEMEELMSGFVQLLTDGRHEAVSLSEEFEPTLYENGVPVEVVSGGCEDISALAMRLALSQMIAQRAGHPLSLLVLDEPFGSLDAVRRGNVLGLVRRLKSVFPQVIVISHVEETRDAVDHAFEFEHDAAAGCTRLVGGSLTTEAP